MKGSYGIKKLYGGAGKGYGGGGRICQDVNVIKMLGVDFSIPSYQVCSFPI